MTKPIKMFSILARGEDRNGKLVGILLTVSVACVVTIVSMALVINQQQATISTLSSQRVMFGFPDDDGIFVSSDTIPESFIIRYAKQFAGNYLNYDFRSAKLNMQEARSMMSPPTAEQWTPEFQKKIAYASEQRIAETLMFTEEPSIKTMKDGYDVSFNARLTKYQAGDVWYDNDVVVTVSLKVVEPTKYRKEGLEVTDLRVEEGRP